VSPDSTSEVTVTGFHEGEIATQRRAGVVSAAKRLETMLGNSGFSAGATRFLASQSFAALTGRDGDGLLWVSPLAAAPGFLQAHDDVLRVAARPRAGDPLHQMREGQPVGVICVDFAARRRLRINGTLAGSDGAGMTVRVDQTYGNCPKYIHPRRIDVGAFAPPPPARARRATCLDRTERAMIAASDTFFLGTTHPTRGSDASHRGGPAGFVRVDSPARLWWPDYPGNNMFNSFGNLAIDDESGLLFVDFTTGATVQLSGTARVRWTDPGAPGDDGGVGRRVEFFVDAVAHL
jgi:predicted pyridoxine 5'-phosphate oxidase superfamily flavin-nucleotide-binding protein